VRKITRRSFIVAGALGAAGAAVGADGLIESGEPQVKKVEIVLTRLPPAFDCFTIAQLSDFHYDEHFSVVPIKKSIELVNELRPELTVLTGDFVTVPPIQTVTTLRRAALTAIPCAALLKTIAGSKLAILGNHDCGSNATMVAGTLLEHGIPVLRNRALPLERGNGRIWIAGIDDVLRGSPDTTAAMSKIPSHEMTILLAHEPDFADYSARLNIDMQLSGHSHGGQVRLPLIGAPYLPPLARKYPRGIYRIGPLVLYTNVGIGTIKIPVRINCQPEVTLITLRAGRA
jgi:uncharacterized protein